MKRSDKKVTKDDKNKTHLKRATNSIEDSLISFRILELQDKMYK